MEAPIRITKSVDGGHVILSYTPGIANEDSLLEWVSFFAPQVNETIFATFAHNVRSNYDPDGTADLRLKFVPSNRRGLQVSYTYILPNGGRLCFGLTDEPSNELRLVLDSYGRTFKPSDKKWENQASQRHVYDQLLLHGHVAPATFKGVTYVDPDESGIDAPSTTTA